MGGKEDSIPFSLEVVMHSLCITVLGNTTAEVLKKTKLDPESIKNYIGSSDECREYMKAWGFDNLMRIRESLAGYLDTMFQHYRVRSLQLEWKNGSDAITLG